MTKNLVGYEIGEYQLDVVNRKLLYQQTEITLSERGYLLLLTLAQASPEIVTKQILMNKLWPDRVVSDWALSRLLSDTRALLQKNSKQDDPMKTARGIGYALSHVKSIYQQDKVALDQPPNLAALFWQYLGRYGFVGIIAVGLFMLIFYVQYPNKPEKIPYSDGPIHSIAVLPLETFSQNQDLAFFADGLTEELIHQLTRLPDLSVVSRNATFAFKNQNIDPREIAKRLNVTHIIEGSVRQSDDKVRITLQLIRAADGYHQWSKVFESKQSANMQVQEEIGSSIAALISPTFDQRKFNIMRNHPKSDAAYAHFLKAAVLMGKDESELLGEAKKELNSALALAPDYALAHAAMARAILLQHQFAKLPLTIAGPQARQHIEAALKIEPSSAEAYSALGLYYTYHDNFTEAENAYRKALSINPALVSAQHNLGFSYWMQNQYDLAAQHFESALALNPLSPMSNFALADTLYAQGFLDKAIAQYEHCLTVIVDFPACLVGLSGLRFITGNEQQAAELLEKSASILGEANQYVMGNRARIALWHNDFTVAEKYLQPLIRVDGEYIHLRHMTQVQLGLGKITSWHQRAESLLTQNPSSNTLRLITALSAYYNHDCARAVQLYEQVMAENPSKHSGLDDFSMGISHISNMLVCYQEANNEIATSQAKALFAGHLSQLDTAAKAVLGVTFIQQKYAWLTATLSEKPQWQDEKKAINWPLAWLEKERLKSRLL
jgi:TolB-like protein/tetratricopeptide (TPR) repeat protein/DNA-binding winged helix-turn-helix (wHTH) protein